MAVFNALKEWSMKMLVSPKPQTPIEKLLNRIQHPTEVDLIQFAVVLILILLSGAIFESGPVILKLVKEHVLANFYIPLYMSNILQRVQPLYTKSCEVVSYFRALVAIVNLRAAVSPRYAGANCFDLWLLLTVMADDYDDVVVTIPPIFSRALLRSLISWLFPYLSSMWIPDLCYFAFELGLFFVKIDQIFSVSYYNYGAGRIKYRQSMQMHLLNFQDQQLEWFMLDYDARVRRSVVDMGFFIICDFLALIIRYDYQLGLH